MKESFKIGGQAFHLSGRSLITCSECYKRKSFPETVSFTFLGLFVKYLVAYACSLSNSQGLNDCLGENSSEQPRRSHRVILFFPNDGAYLLAERAVSVFPRDAKCCYGMPSYRCLEFE